VCWLPWFKSALTCLWNQLQNPSRWTNTRVLLCCPLPCK
jgi:hypothetical protein